MKRLLTLFLVLWCSTAWAVEPINLASTNPYVAGAWVAASCTSPTIDLWQNFNFSTPADAAAWATALQGTDHNASATAAVTDATGWATTNTDVKTLSFCPGGTADTTSYNLTKSGTTEGYVRTLKDGADANTVSAAGWYYSADVPSFGGTQSVMRFSSGAAWGTSLIQNSPSSQEKLETNCTSDNTSLDISVSTWYWIAARHVAGGTSTFRVYDTSNAEITGSPLTCTIANNAMGRLNLGGLAGYALTADPKWGAWLFDWTNAKCRKQDGTECSW